MDGLVALATSVCLSVHAGDRQFCSWLFACEGVCVGTEIVFVAPQTHFWRDFGAQRDTVAAWMMILVLQSTLTS